MSATRICAPSAAAQSRAASITGVPKQSSASQVTSPRLIPMRTRERLDGRTPIVAVDRLLDRDAGRDRVGRTAKGGHDPVADALRAPSRGEP